MENSSLTENRKPLSLSKLRNSDRFTLWKVFREGMEKQQNKVETLVFLLITLNYSPFL